jgi:hypothetical protein
LARLVRTFADKNNREPSRAEMRLLLRVVATGSKP